MTSGLKIVLDSLENKNITVLKMTDYVSLLNEKNPDHTDGDEADEHIWTSVRNAEQLVKKISDVVMEKDNKINLNMKTIQISIF